MFVLTELLRMVFVYPNIESAGTDVCANRIATYDICISQHRVNLWAWGPSPRSLWILMRGGKHIPLTLVYNAFPHFFSSETCVFPSSGFSSAAGNPNHCCSSCSLPPRKPLHSRQRATSQVFANLSVPACVATVQQGQHECMLVSRLSSVMGICRLSNRAILHNLIKNVDYIVSVYGTIL
jgi:hypothetical protein